MNYAEIIREHLSGIINEGSWMWKGCAHALEGVMCVTS